MTAKDLHTYLRSEGPWVDPERTVDTFKWGDPGAEVNGVAVSWMSRWATLKAAHAQGLNVFVTHEPTFWDHLENPVHGTAEDRKAKEAWLEDSGMVVIRCHDMLDQMPGYGIQDGWAKWLGIHGKPYEQIDQYRRVYDTEPVRLADLAKQVAEKLAPLGQHWVEFLGDPDQLVSHPGIGTGAIVGGVDALVNYRNRGSDVVLLTEHTRWRELAWAEDVGLALLLIAHSVSEAPSMMALADHLQERYPDVPVTYVPAECPTKLATAS